MFLSNKKSSELADFGSLLIWGFLIGMTIYKVVNWIREHKTKKYDEPVVLHMDSSYSDIPVIQATQFNNNIVQQQELSNHTTISSYVGNDSLW